MQNAECRMQRMPTPGFPFPILNFPFFIISLAGIGVLGSIVAPNAAISFPQGNLDGLLIGASLEGGGALHHYPPAVCLPEPATP